VSTREPAGTAEQTDDGPGPASGTTASGDRTHPELASLSYEQARDALLDVVRRLESGSETLEESLALWERGEALAARCETWLEGARTRIDAGRRPTPGAAAGREG
jgi:exodeoxyribonuclease VII small subunit